MTSFAERKFQCRECLEHFLSGNFNGKIQFMCKLCTDKLYYNNGKYGHIIIPDYAKKNKLNEYKIDDMAKYKEEYSIYYNIKNNDEWEFDDHGRKTITSTSEIIMTEEEFIATKINIEISNCSRCDQLKSILYNTKWSKDLCVYCITRCLGCNKNYGYRCSDKNCCNETIIYNPNHIEKTLDMFFIPVIVNIIMSFLYN